jgi:hypothetical protein
MSTLTSIRTWVGNLLHPADVPAQTGGPDTEPPTSGLLAAPGRGEDLLAEHASGHAPGHRHLGPPPETVAPHWVAMPPPRHAAWHDIGGRVDRLRRNERRRG